MADPGSSSSTRLPKPLYRGHNGFTTSVELAMAGSVVGPSANINLHVVVDKGDSASKEERQMLYDAVQRRQFVEDMMELKGSFFPGYVLHPHSSPTGQLFGITANDGLPD